MNGGQLIEFLVSRMQEWVSLQWRTVTFCEYHFLWRIWLFPLAVSLQTVFGWSVPVGASNVRQVNFKVRPQVHEMFHDLNRTCPCQFLVNYATSTAKIEKSALYIRNYKNRGLVRSLSGGRFMHRRMNGINRKWIVRETTLLRNVRRMQENNWRPSVGFMPIYWLMCGECSKAVFVEASKRNCSRKNERIL
jgi:hypothetical protein